MLHDMTLWIEIPETYSRAEVRGTIADMTRPGSALHVAVARELLCELRHRRQFWAKNWELQKSKQSAPKI